MPISGLRALAYSFPKVARAAKEAAEAEARAARAADKEARRQAWAAKREAEGWHEASDDDTQGKE
jgi:hypothetical protein